MLTVVPYDDTRAFNQLVRLNNKCLLSKQYTRPIRILGLEKCSRDIGFEIFGAVFRKITSL